MTLAPGSQAKGGGDTAEMPWQNELYQALQAGGIRQMSYVPDAGHARLINFIEADPDIEATVLTSEEEGIALSAGAWLGGQRSVLLMQSSGVGNCINMLSLMANCRFPLVTIVTMRGEWAEFNPWQIPMGSVTEQSMDLMGVRVFRVDRPEDVVETIQSAMIMAFDGDQRVAIVLSQRMLGQKKWAKEIANETK